MTQAHQSQQALAACGVYPPQAAMQVSSNQYSAQPNMLAPPHRRPLMIELECTNDLINEIDTVISELEARLQPVLLLLPPAQAQVNVASPAGIVPISPCPATSKVTMHHEMLRSLNRRLVAISERVVA